jgi:hypothetical protein
MARTTFDCLGLMTAGVTPYTTLDSRSGVGLTNPVGQMAFFGSSDNSGPLGMVFQHFCGHGMCRVDITSTRYGVSGNDLSLNIDSTNPYTTGGMLIKYGGGVAIATGQPCGALDVYRQGSGALGSGDILILRGGNNSSTFGTNQIRLGYAGGIGYSHAIKTRHQSASNYQNAIDFFLWNTTDAIETTGSRLVMTLDGTGNVGIGTCAPATHNGVGLVINGRGSDTRGILELWDSSGGKSVLQNVGGDTYLGQLAKGAGSGNLHLLTGGGGTSATISMTILCAGNVGIGTVTPDSKLHICNAVAGGTNNYSVIIQNACTVADARSGIAFSNNSQTPSQGGLSGASIQTSNNGIDGTGNLLFGTLLNGVNAERMRISHNGNVGVGISSPGFKLHVDGSAGNTIGFFGASAMTSNQTVFLQLGKNCTSTNNAGEISFKYVGDDNASNMVSLGFYGNGQLLNVIKNGNVGINSCTPGSYKLYVNGSFYSAGSSCEYKQSICQYNTDSCMFMKLKPVTYQYKDEWCHLGKELKSGTQIGLIAEDTAEVFPELAILKDEDEQKVVRNVDYEKLSIILLSEVQKLRKEVDNLKNNK